MPRPRRIDRNLGGKCDAAGVDRVIGALADGQHGRVSRTQLLQAGVGRDAIDYRLRCGRLRPVHHGVYAVGHTASSRQAGWMAAVLACGPNAALSHRSAAALWGLRSPSFGEIEVTVPGSAHRRRGIRAYRNLLPGDERVEREGIAVTTVARTLFDLAAVLPGRQVEHAINEAEIRRFTDHLPLPALLDRYPRRRGARAIRLILPDLRSGAQITKSELEDRFHVFLDRTGLPRPETNVWLEVGDEWIEVDCLWRRQGLVVELDGRAFHATATAFERDRTRDRLLAVAGLRTIRVTWRQLHTGALALERDLRRLLK